MPVIKLETLINASNKIVFDLSRSIDFQSNFVGSNEKAIAGRTTGLIELNETVTWRGKHVGVMQELTSKITDYDRPYFFADEMQKGAFKSLRHEHYFIAKEGGTLMKDVFIFTSPFGLLGKLANTLFLTSYMTGFLKRRNNRIKEYAENGKWRNILPKSEGS